MTPYIYTPLNESENEIRVLNLLPDTFGSTIHVTLHTIPFNKTSVPSFEALSYTWGSTENCVDIIIHSPDEKSLSVTPNLAEALLHLRYEDRPRLLWIDAISINQRDLAERSSQVSLMADIFSKAYRVVIWLGPEVEDTPLAIECISLIASKVNVDWDMVRMYAVSTEKHWADLEESLPFDKRECSALLHFFESEWFERLWIWQEARLGSLATIALRGTRHVLWAELRKAACCLYLKPDLVDQDNFRLRINTAYRLCNQRNDDDMPNLIAKTRHCKCADPRDRVFAVLSLCTDTAKMGIEVDYTKTVVEVYKDALFCFLRRTECLMLEDMRPGGALVGAPSWVPNWTIPNSCYPIQHLSASMSTKSTVNILPNDVLEVLGVDVAHVESTKHIDFPDRCIYYEVIVAIRSLISSLNPPGELASKSDHVRSICQTLMTGYYAESYDPTLEHTPSISEIEEVVNYLSSEDWPQYFPNVLGRFLRSMFHYSKGRTMFTTKTGSMGIGPETMQAGDIVTVLLGCNTAIILRPKYERTYEVVGQAYLDGFMSGEALLGPYPGQWEQIVKHDENSSRYYGIFVDRKTGAFQPEDPRLGDLPDGWRRESHPKERWWTKFVHESGEILRGGYDPRLSPQALRDRGVDLKTFILI